MKNPRLSSYFTPDELESLLMQIDLHNRNGISQVENLWLYRASDIIGIARAENNPPYHTHQLKKACAYPGNCHYSQK